MSNDHSSYVGGDVLPFLLLPCFWMILQSGCGWGLAKLKVPQPGMTIKRDACCHKHSIIFLLSCGVVIKPRGSEVQKYKGIICTRKERSLFHKPLMLPLGISSSCLSSQGHTEQWCILLPLRKPLIFNFLTATSLSFCQWKVERMFEELLLKK